MREWETRIIDIRANGDWKVSQALSHFTPYPFIVHPILSLYTLSFYCTPYPFCVVLSTCTRYPRMHTSRAPLIYEPKCS